MGLIMAMRMKTSSQWNPDMIDNDNPYSADPYNLNLPAGKPTSGIGDYLSGVQTGSTVKGASTGNPYAAGAGLLLDLVGTGMSAYGTYEQNQAIQKQNELAKQIFEEERLRSQEKDRQAREAELLQRDFGYGNYARSEQDDVLNDFGGYAGRVGL